MTNGGSSNSERKEARAAQAGDGRHLHEECGVFGVYAPERRDVARLAYYGLYALQHRGQESAGMVVNDDGRFSAWCDVGLVNEVFTPERLRSLGEGEMVVGHVRYATTGSDNKRNVQPLVINHYKGHMALAHNGNLTNSRELRDELERLALPELSDVVEVMRELPDVPADLVPQDSLLREFIGGSTLPY